MNFRTTTFFFALLLTMLWVFGLMIAHKKTSGDQGLIMPTLADAKIDSITIARTEKGKELAPVTFEKKGDDWYLREGKQETRVENLQINRMFEQVRDLKPEEDTDVSKEPSFYGLNAPELVAVFKGKARDGEAKEWKFTVGKVSPDLMAYVGSSDRPEKAFAVAKRGIESLYFDNANYLRPKHLFDFMDSAVNEVIAKQGSKELDLKRGEGSLWSFVQPPLGYAGPDNPEPQPEAKKKLPFTKEPEEEKGIHGVKALLEAIKAIRIEDDADFVPLGKEPIAYGLESGKENVRVEVRTEKDKEANKEILLIGKEAESRNKKDRFYYARKSNDEGVFLLNAKFIEPIIKAIAEPGKIRSRDIAAFDAKAVDAVIIKQGKEEFKFLLPEKKAKEQPFPRPAVKDEAWQMYEGGEKKTASLAAVDKLIEETLGKGAIVKFIDEPDEKAQKAFDSQWSLDKPLTEIAVYTGAVEPEKKEEAKEKKDEKDKKDEKAKAETKDDKKGPALTLKKDAKPVVTLAIGKADNDLVYVRRTLQDGTTVSRFAVKKEFIDKILPPEGIALAYLDLTLPGFPVENVFAMNLTRMTEKGPEKLEFQQRFVDDRSVWFVKDPLEKSGYRRANDRLVGMIHFLSALPVKKWVKKLDEKEDLDKYGLKNPQVTVSVSWKKTPVTHDSPIAMLPECAGDPIAFSAVLGLVVQQAQDKGETMTFEFGKETEDEKDKPGVFGRQSKSKLLFLVAPNIVRELKEQDFYDRSGVLYTQAEIEALYKGSAALNPFGLLLLASPQITGQIHNLDPDKIKEVRLSVRTPYELRTFAFERGPKDKTWIDKSNLQEFKLDSDKVNQLVKELAKLKTDRFVAFTGGPRGDHKLGPKEVNVRIDLTTDDGKAVTLLVGARYQQYGYFANSSVWPETVFFLPATLIDPLLRGPDYFAKERSLLQ